MDFAANTFDYVNQNTVHPLGLAALAVACILVALGPIRLIPLVLIGLAVYIPSAQRVVPARIGLTVAAVDGRGHHFGPSEVIGRQRIFRISPVVE